MNQPIQSSHLHNHRRLVVLAGILTVAMVIMLLVVNAMNRFSTQEVTVLQSEPAPVLGIVMNEERKVVTVEPGSAAATAGIQVGDVLVAVADTPIASHADMVTVLQALRGTRGMIAPTAQLSADPQEQAIRDATAVALSGKDRPALKRMDLTFRRGTANVRKQVQLQPLVRDPNAPTPTPLPQNMIYL